MEAHISVRARYFAAMSQENVEIVRAGFDAWNAGDMNAYGDLLDSEVTVRTPRGWPEPGPFVGREAALRQFKLFRDAWDADAAEPNADFMEVGDRVLASFFWRGSGHGPDASREIWCLYTLRAGKHLAFEFFWDKAEAREAAGLSA